MTNYRHKKNVIPANLPAGRQGRETKINGEPDLYFNGNYPLSTLTYKNKKS